MKNVNPFLYILFFAAFTLSSADLQAHFGSKGPFGGTVSCAITHNGFVYLGTTEGGVYESTNTQLVGWRARPVGLKSGKITALAHSGSYLFAGTADSGLFIFNGFVGNDRYWNKINTGLGNLQIRSLQALDSITILAGTEGGGLYKTTNKGANWSLVVDAALMNKTISAMAYSGSRIFLTVEDEGVFISDDGGSIWSSFNDPATLNISGTKGLSYNGVSDELYVFNANGLFHTTTAASATNPMYTSATGLPMGIGIRALTNNGGYWFLATSMGFYKETAGSPGWNPFNAGLPHTDATAVVALSDTLILGVRKQGVFKSPAGTVQWVANNTNLNNPVTRTMVCAGDSLVISVTEEGVFVSRDLATSYIRANHGLTDSGAVNDIILANGVLLAATTNGGVFVSADSGKTWNTMNDGLLGLNITRLFYANGKRYAMVAGKLYSALLAGSTWKEDMDGLQGGESPSVLCSYANRIYIGTKDHGVFWREESDSVWMAFNTGLTDMNVTALTASGNRIYAGTDASGIFVSRLDSNLWKETPVPAIAHSTMLGIGSNGIQDMATYGGFVYASYKGGLVATMDSGKTWIPGGNQFNLPSFTDVKKIGFVKSRVFVTTEYNGLYSNALSELPLFPDTFLIVVQDAIGFSASGGLKWATVNSNSYWSATSHVPWVSITHPNNVLDGNITIEVEPNPGPPRFGFVEVNAGSKWGLVRVVQTGPGGLAELEGAIKLYPNPNKGSFQLDYTDLEGKVERISVISISGNTLFEKAIAEGESSLKVESSLSSGVYLVRIQTTEGNLVKKVVIH